MYKRILLKISGEMFGSQGSGLELGNPDSAIDSVARIIQDVHQKTYAEMAIVVGAGNLFRARYVSGTAVDRVVADQIGMLGTLMNALALQEAMERMGNDTRVMSAIPTNSVCEPYIRRKAMRHMEKGRIVILGGGTGNPYCTTDFASALRSIELKCDVILKASNVDAIYDKDPKKFTDAKKLEKVTYQYALENQLKIMDSTAFALCQDEDMPIVVFNFDKPENIEKIINGDSVGTLIHK